MIEHLNTIAQGWWNWMWPMFWQVSVLIVLIGVVDLLLRRGVWPQVRYALWLLVLLKLILPPSFSLSTSVISQARIKAERFATQVTASNNPVKPASAGLNSEMNSFNDNINTEFISTQEAIINTVTNESPVRTDTIDFAVSGTNIKIRWQVYVMAIWFAIVLALSVWVARRFRHLRRFHDCKLADNDMPQWFGPLLEETAKKLGLRRSPEIALSKNVSSPAVFGILRPILVLPADTIHHLSPERTEHILMHELAHIKRGDLLVNTIYMLLQIVYWFNPLLWVLRRKLQHLRELCCDATVARILRSKTMDYRETILEVTRRFMPKPSEPGIGLLGMAETSSRLLVRLKWMEKKTWKYRGLRIAIIFVVVGFMSVCVLPMAKAANSDVLTVAVDGTAKYSSIQKAIDAAAAGAVIRIRPGLYEERLEIDKPLTLEGAGWERTTIMTKSADADAFEEAMRTLNARMQEAKSDEQRKEIAAKFRAEFKEKYGKPTLLVSNTENVGLRDLKLTSPGRCLEGRSMSVPIVEFRNAKASVSKCVVIGTPGDGVHILNGSDVEIRDSLVAAVWSTGIVVGDRQGERSGVRLLDSELRNCHYAGIRIRKCNDSTRLERCRISGAAWHGIRYDDCSPKIIDNRVFGSARCGIYASGQTAAVVRGNLFYANEMVGMSCWFQNRDTIEGNTFAGNKRSGLEILGASKPIVKKNIFFSEPNGVQCANIGSDSAYAISDGIVTLEKNLFWKNEHNAVRRLAKTNKTEEITLEQQAGNLEMDPMFTNATRDDFSLMENSPARRLGIGVAEPIGFESLWPLQPEEVAIIPDGQTRDYRQWKKPVLSESGRGSKHKKPDLHTEAAKTGTSEEKLNFEQLLEEYKVLVAQLDKEMAAYRASMPVFAKFSDVVATEGPKLNQVREDAGARLAEARKSGVDLKSLKYDEKASEKIISGILAGMFGDIYSEFQKALDAGKLRLPDEQQTIYYRAGYFVTQSTKPLSGQWYEHSPYEQGTLEYCQFVNQLTYTASMLLSPLVKMAEQAPDALQAKQRRIDELYGQLVQLKRQSESNVTLGPKYEDPYMKKLKASAEKKPGASRSSNVETTKKSDLQKLVDSARDGATVIVPKGVYTEPVIVTKSLTLKGESVKDCIIEVTANEPAIFVDTKGKGKVVVEAVTVKWQLATSDKCEYPFAVAVKDSNVEVKNCCFNPLGDFKRSPVAIYSRGFSELNINTCRFEGFEYTVCFGQGTKGAIRNSIIMDSGHQGIILYAGATAEVIGNVVTGSRYHAVRSTGGTLNMRDNLIIKNANRGVYLGNKSARGTIANNVIIGNGTGISGFARSNVNVENNIIADSSYAGIGMRDSCSLSIRGNIFRGNERGWILFKEGSRNGNTVYKNTFWRNKIETENLDKTAGSLVADPGFVDAENGDFSLKPGPALQQKQGLTNPEILQKLWKIWKNREDKNMPFTEN